MSMPVNTNQTSPLLMSDVAPIIFSLFPDALFQEWEGEVLICTSMRLVNDEFIPIGEYSND